MQRINIVIPCSLIYAHSTSGNKWECEHAVGGVIVSSPLRFSGSGCYMNSHHELNCMSPSRETPILNTSVQNMMNCTGAYKWHHFTTCISRKQA